MQHKASAASSHSPEPLGRDPDARICFPQAGCEVLPVVPSCRMHCVSLLPSTMSGDELLLWQGPGQGNSQQEYFWTNFVKGAARSATLLFLLALTKGAGWELQVLHPQLYETVLAIHCRCDTCLDVQAAAYQNAVLSQAGSIRKAHDVPTWLAKIQFLLQKGVSAETVIKSWNARANSKEPSERACSTCCNAPSQPWISCSGMPAPLVLRLRLLKRPSL